jgi:hypothetical protein
MRIARFLLAEILCFDSSAEAQSGGMIVAHSLPDDLQSSLEERFSAFVEAQAALPWSPTITTFCAGPDILASKNIDQPLGKIHARN